MPQLPARFAFAMGRPCVEVRVGGPDRAGADLTLLLDLAADDYDTVLYWHAMSGLIIRYFGPLDTLTLPDGSQVPVQTVYIDFDHWNVATTRQVKVLHAVRFARNIGGMVSGSFFGMRKVEIDWAARQLTVS